MSTDKIYAKISYRNELILMIDLNTYDFIVYDTEYKDKIVTDLSSQGVFYVPGLITTDMNDLYKEDEFAKTNNIVGIKLLIKDNKISVEYQESPKDLCEYQPPTSSHLRPIVCLPNELVINVYTDLVEDDFIIDSVLE